MPSDQQIVSALRVALEATPENVPLRCHLAETLREMGQLEQAVEEFRAALQRQPNSQEASLGLCRSYHQVGKRNEALVVIENLVERGNPGAEAHVLYARLLLFHGDVSAAVEHYKTGIDLDPDAADETLANQLGVHTFDEGDELFEGRLRNAADTGRGDDGPADVERPKNSFADVGGMEGVKEEISLKIILPLKHPEMYAAYGKSAGGGILMYGPPGCGKTHLARATAGEIDAAFLSVGISDVLDMWIGASEKNLRALFNQARAAKPAVLFFDEVDALGSKRSDLRNSAGRQLINQFLAELDGLEQANDGLLVLAATNAPWHMDSAFRRPGRFDRVLFVPPPDQAARESILTILLTGKPTQDADVTLIARKTDGFSGADLKAVIDQAIEAKLREAMKTGVVTPLATKDLTAAARKLKPTTKEWFSTAKNYALYSNQDGLYDDIVKHLKM